MNLESERSGTRPFASADRGPARDLPTGDLPAASPAARPTAKERILAVALDEFARYGYSGASLRAIASAAHIDVALIAYYYGNKASPHAPAPEPAARAAPAQEASSRNHREHGGAMVAPVLVELETHEEAVKAGQALFRTFLTPAGPDDPVHAEVRNRAAAIFSYGKAHPGTELGDEIAAAFIVGLFLVRHLLRYEPAASAPLPCLEAVLGVLLQRLLDESSAYATRPAPADAVAPVDDDPAPDPYPAPPPRQPDTRTRILEAAQRSFATLGYHGTALRALADEVGCNVALIPYHFGSKAELFREPVAAGLAMPDAIPDLADRRVTDPAATAAAIAPLMLRLFTDEPQGPALRSVILATVAPRPGDEELVGELRTAVQRVIDRVSVDGAEKVASISDEELLGFHLVGAMFLGLHVLRRIVGPDPLASAPDAEIERLLVPLLEWLLDGSFREALTAC